MSKDVMEYKGYYTKIEYSVEDRVLFGKIEGINDLVNFEAVSAEDIEDEFHIAVDEYLEYCESLNIEPDKTYKGSFNVRMSPELHRKSAIEAFKKGVSLNEFVSLALRSYLSSNKINFNLSIYQMEGKKNASIKADSYGKDSSISNLSNYMFFAPQTMTAKAN